MPKTSVRLPCPRHGNSVEGAYDCWPRPAGLGPANTDGVNQSDLEIFRIVTDHFRHDITAFWNHSSFFLLIQGALVAVFSTAVGPQDPEKLNALMSARVEAVVLSLLGLVLALFWWWVARGRRALIDLWREEVVHLDGVVDRHGVYRHVELHVRRHPWREPTVLTGHLPILVAACWLGALGWLTTLG